MVRTVEDDGIADQLRSHAEDAGELVPQGADLLQNRGGGDPVHLPSSPLPGIPAAQQVPPSRLGEKLLGKTDPVLVHVENHLAGYPFDQFPGLVPDGQLLFGKQIFEHHELLSCQALTVPAAGQAEYREMRETCQGRKKRPLGI